MNKKLQQKWEKKLQKYGLGIDQPLTDNSEGEMADFTPVVVRGNAKNQDTARLRSSIDSDDLFMGAHQITKVREREREIPEWVMRNAGLQNILLLAFPRMHTHKKERKKAGVWARALYLYYRMRLPRQIVAKEMKIELSDLNNIIQRTGFLSQGLTKMGKVRKRKLIALQRTDEGLGEKGDETK